MGTIRIHLATLADMFGELDPTIFVLRVRRAVRRNGHSFLTDNGNPPSWYTVSQDADGKALQLMIDAESWPWQPVDG